MPYGGPISYQLWASVLYKTEKGDYRSGLVSDFDEGLVEVLLDENSDEEISVEHITPIAKERERAHCI